MVARIRSYYLVYFISAFAAITGLLFGYDTGVISGAILFIRKDFHLTSMMTGVTVSAVLFGAFLGSAISGKMTDEIGRKKALVVVSLIFLFGTLLTAVAPNDYFLILGRTVLGMAIGIGSFTAPLYLAEIAPFHIRGFLVSLNQLAITIGIILAYVIDYIFAGHSNWRLMLGFGVLPAAILFAGTFFLPESPRWMMLKGMVLEAEENLKSIRGTEDVLRELTDIRQSVHEKQGTWRMLFSKKLRPILFISLGLAFFQQVTGINTIIYYAPTILQQAGFSEATTAILATLAIGIFNVVFTIIALPLIDRWGRRPLLLMGLGGMFVSLVAQSIAFYFPQLEYLRWLTVSSMIFYIACFAMSLGPIMWLVISEIFPLEIRGVGISVAVSCCWAFNMLVALTLLSLIDAIGISGTFWMYASLCVVGVLFVYFMVPETKGCSLEQIENNLRAGRAARELGLAIRKKKRVPELSPIELEPDTEAVVAE